MALKNSPICILGAITGVTGERSCERQNAVGELPAFSTDTELSVDSRVALRLADDGRDRSLLAPAAGQPTTLFGVIFCWAFGVVAEESTLALSSVRGMR